MDNTLNNYIDRINEITDNKNIMTNKEKKRDQNEMKQMISYMENTLLLLKDKYDNYLRNKEKKKKDIDLKAINISLYSHTTNHINLNLINETNQYSIKINNLILYGNIGNIYDKNILLNDKIQAHQVVPCVYKNECKNILNNKYCKYFHDPNQLFELKILKIISADFYDETIKYVRNFANTSWIYTPTYTSNTRCIGSNASLLNDIQIATLSQKYKNNIETMKQQVMHDLLILLVLSENNLA